MAIQHYVLGNNVRPDPLLVLYNMYKQRILGLMWLGWLRILLYVSIFWSAISKKIRVLFKIIFNETSTFVLLCDKMYLSQRLFEN